MKKTLTMCAAVLAMMMLAFLAGCANGSDSESPATDNKAQFVGTWKSPDGEWTSTITADKFSTKVEGIETPFDGTWTIGSDGKSFTAEIDPGTGTKVNLTLKLVDGEDDVVTGEIPESFGGGTTTLVKTTTTAPAMDGTWTGVVYDEDATLTWAENKATLTIGGQDVESSSVTLDATARNFFTITWEEENALYLTESTGIVSASGKAYLDNGAIFIKQK